MQTGLDNFVIRKEYNLKMMESQLRTSPKKVKRFRSAFTTDQVNYLEKQFKTFPYIGNAHRKEVAIALSIPERAVKIWFQNRRMKEKKEITGKEFDDEPCNRKSMEFVKNQLNNVNKPSANDQQSYSLPLLTDVSNLDSDKNMSNNLPSSTEFMPESTFQAFEGGTTNTVHTAPAFINPHQPISPNNFAKTAEFSINLCKKYKNECNSNPSFADKPISVDEKNIKKGAEKQPMNYKIMEQIVPEDLSSNGKNKIVPTAGHTQVTNMGPNNPGYISVVPNVQPFYAQPYYTASGVLWKPVTIVPTVTSPGASIPVPNNLGTIPTIQESTPKKCCNCDCHIKPLLPYNFQQPSPSPQYLITAVQFPNPSASKY